VNGSLLPRHVDTQLRSLERVGESDCDPITALRETVEAVWKLVERVASEPALDAARHDARALLARRELMQRATCVLSAVIQRGVESGAFRPACASWAIRRLPFAIVAGACVHWVFGLATTPSQRVSVAVEATLEVLRPRWQRHGTGRPMAFIPSLVSLKTTGVAPAAAASGSASRSPRTPHWPARAP
jgi:hypothetical protein